MLISRENIARLIEKPAANQFIGELQDNLGIMAQNIEQMISAMLTGVAPAGVNPQDSLNALSQKMQSTMGRFRSEADDVQNMFAPGEINGVEDARVKIFPRIVEYNVAQLLKVRDVKDISRVNSLLAQLREQGIAAVWEQILPNVTAHTVKICGSIFPEEYIDAGKTQVLDMAYLSSLVETGSAAVTNTAPAAPVASAAEASRAAPVISNMGMRFGFLNRSQPKPAQQESRKPDDSAPRPQ